MFFQDLSPGTSVTKDMWPPYFGLWAPSKQGLPQAWGKCDVQLWKLCIGCALLFVKSLFIRVPNSCTRWLSAHQRFWEDFGMCYPLTVTIFGVVVQIWGVVERLSFAQVVMMANICLQTYLVSNLSALLTRADVGIYTMRFLARTWETNNRNCNKCFVCTCGIQTVRKGAASTFDFFQDLRAAEACEGLCCTRFDTRCEDPLWRPRESKPQSWCEIQKSTHDTPGAIAELRSLQVFDGSGRVICENRKTLRSQRCPKSSGCFDVSRWSSQELESSVMAMLPELYRRTGLVKSRCTRNFVFLLDMDQVYWTSLVGFSLIQNRGRVYMTENHDKSCAFWIRSTSARKQKHSARQRISSLLYSKLVREVELFSGCAKRSSPETRIQ